MVNETQKAPIPAEKAANEIPTGEIPIFVTKSALHRVIHVDGVYGGGTPTPGNIMMTVFSHRIPFPEKVINDSKGFEIPSRREGKYGIEQEYEASLVMSLDTAKIIAAWLNNTIRNSELLLQQIQQQNPKK